MGEHDDLEQAGNGHGLLLIVAKDVRYVLRELKKQNGRISGLEDWKQKVAYTGAGALLMSPLAFADVRTFLAQLLGG